MHEEWTDTEIEMLERIRALGDEMHSAELNEDARRESRAEFERLVEIVLEKHPPPGERGPSQDPPSRW
jgi:hypothetical protein